MRGYRARCCQPNLVAMPGNVLQCAPQMPQAVRLADDIGVQGDAHHERLLFALLQHFVEMIHYHLGKRRAFNLAGHYHRHVVDLLWIGYGQQASMAGTHPHRLVVHAPVQHVFIPVGRQKVWRAVAFRYPWPKPATGRPTFLSREHGCGFGYQRGFGRLVQVALAFAVGPAMSDDFVAPSPKSIRQARYPAINFGIYKHRGRHGQFVQKVDQPPGTHTVAVIAPSIIEHIRLRPARCQLRAQSLAKRENFKVDGDIDGQPPAPGPFKLRAPLDRRVIIAPMSWHQRAAR